jgi:Cu-processing system permease protein
MIVTWAIAEDILREALRRRWFLVLGIAVTLCLMVLLGTLRLDAVENTLAASRHAATAAGDGHAVGQIFNPLFRAAAYLIFYGGILFGVISCAEFAPSLLSPGRIEHLLSLPVKRWQLIVGTFIGVWIIASCASLYAAGGLTLILGLKTGIWTLRPIIAGLLSTVAWAAVYATMLIAATLVRSAALSAGIGGIVFIGGIIASNRESILGLFAPGLGKMVFSFLSMLFPRLSSLGAACAQIASSQPVNAGSLASILAGFFAFTVIAVALAIVSLERQDF